MPGKALRNRRARYIRLMDREAEAVESGTLFEALIIPHRSLSPRGLRILIAVICLLSGLIMLRFWLIGAWPVAGFSVAEIGIAIFLLRLNARPRTHERTCPAVRGHVADRAHRKGWPAGRACAAGRLVERGAGRAPGAGAEAAAGCPRPDARKSLQRWAKSRNATFGQPCAKRCISRAIRASTTLSYEPNRTLEICKVPYYPVVSVGPIDLIRSNTRLRTAGSVIR